jgi:hypothetical protein
LGSIIATNGLNEYELPRICENVNQMREHYEKTVRFYNSKIIQMLLEQYKDTYMSGWLKEELKKREKKIKEVSE